MESDELSDSYWRGLWEREGEGPPWWPCTLDQWAGFSRAFERQGEVIPGVSPSGADSKLRPSLMTGLLSLKNPFDCWQELLRSPWMAVSSVRVTDGPVFHPPDRNKPLRPAANSVGAGPLPVNRKPPHKADGNYQKKRKEKFRWKCDRDGRVREKTRIINLNSGEMGVIFLFCYILCTQHNTRNNRPQFFINLFMAYQMRSHDFSSCSSVFSELKWRSLQNRSKHWLVEKETIQ